MLDTEKLDLGGVCTPTRSRRGHSGLRRPQLHVMPKSAGAGWRDLTGEESVSESGISWQLAADACMTFLLR